MIEVRNNPAVDSDVQQFVALVMKGIESWLEAGRLVAEAIKKDAGFVDRVCNQVPGLTSEMVLRFESIGLGRTKPEVFLSDSPGMKRLRRQPIEIQERYLVEPVALLVREGSEHSLLQVDVRNLTRSQTEQVFSRDGVRSDAAQRAWLAERANSVETNVTESGLPYRLTKGRLIVKRPCVFTAGEIARLLAELEN